MKTTYPRSFGEIDSYAKREGIDASVAKQRFAQYGLLRAFSYSQELSDALVLKGGNALNAFWIPNRSTKDLDFSFKRAAISLGTFEAKLKGTFRRVQNELGIIFHVSTGGNNEDENPPEGPPFHVTRLNIAYALEGEYDLARRLEAGEQLPAGSPNLVPIEISTGECVCEMVSVGVDGLYDLQVCSLEDIMAEKLRSLLQQVTRSTGRKQDILDLVVILRSGSFSFDVEKVSRYLRAKAPLRGVKALKSEFRSPKVKEQASIDYETLRGTAKTFVPFEEAFADVLALVESLSIPE